MDRPVNLIMCHIVKGPITLVLDNPHNVTVQSSSLHFGSSGVGVGMQER